MQWKWEYIKLGFRSKNDSRMKNLKMRWQSMCAWMKSKMRKRIPADELLSPKVLKKSDKLYASALQLRAALRNDDCKNIAITGMYGSGKSSVIRTAIKRMPKRKILSISFVNYKNSIEAKAEKEMLGVENKIFQHILYKANESQTRKSSFRRLAPQSKGGVIGIIIWFITVLFSIAVLCHIQWVLLPSSWHNLYPQLINENWRAVIRVAVQSLSFVNIIAFLIFLLYQGYYFFSKIHIRSIEAKNVRIEIGDIEKVNFDKLLGEILYYLRAGGYKVVVFEDLDRIKVSEDLFIKLREINILLNESSFHQSHNRVTHFIYAIRDDVYQGEMRTKCFDYVIPIVPIVDKNNIEEYLVNLQSHNDYKVSSISNRDLLRLGTYISGKRALNHIFNEYMMYRSIIDTKKSLTETKFLALIIYKNLFPHDFSLIYERKGCLYSLFTNKKKFSDAINKSNFKAREQFDNDIENVKNELIKQRKAIIDYLIEKEAISHLKVEGRMVPISEFSQNEVLFQQIVQGTIRECVYQDDEQGNYEVKFDDILTATKEMDFAETHAESLEQLSQKQKEKLDIEKKIARIEAYSLRMMLRLLTSDEGKNILGGICDEAVQQDSNYSMSDTEKQSLKERLYEFITADYISEQYSLYMSVPYTGMLTEEEIEYLHAILRREKLHWWDKLPNVKNLVNRLGVDDFSDTAILNYDILNYLLECENPTSDEKIYLNTFINTSRKEPSFIIDGAIRIPKYRLYVDKLFEEWNECIKEISQIADTGRQNSMLVLFFVSAPKIELDSRDRQTLSAYYSLINTNIKAMDMERLSALIRNNHIKFNQIIKPQDEATTKWYEFVLNNECFAISLANLLQIYGDDFNTEGLTLIYKDERKPLRKYLLKNINRILELLPKTDIKESEETIQDVINDIDVEERLLEQFVLRQRRKINLSGIKGNDKKILLLKWNKVYPTWQNVDDASLSEMADDDIMRFICANVKELSEQQCDLPNKDDIGLWLLYDNQSLTNDDFRKLAPVIPIKISANTLEEDEESDMPTPERMRILIQLKYLEYDKAMNTIIHSHYSSEVFAEYVISYFEEIQKNGNFDEEISNTEGKLILSALSEEQKPFYLKNYFELQAEEMDRSEYAMLAVEAYAVSQEKISKDELSDLLAALSIYPERPNGESWRLKIGLINRVLSDIECSVENLKVMITILGGGYLELLTAPKFKDFDGNDENWQLLSKLKSLYPQRISRVYSSPADERMIRVTFRANSAQNVEGNEQ